MHYKALPLIASLLALVVGCAGLDESEPSPREDKSDSHDSSDDILGEQADFVLQVLNEECIFQSCDGDFDWAANAVYCDTKSESCTVRMEIAPHSHIGVFNAANVSGAIGRELFGDTFIASIDGSFVDEGELFVEVSCQLFDYALAGDLLAEDSDGNIVGLTPRFRAELLTCIIASTDIHEGLGLDALVEAPSF